MHRADGLFLAILAVSTAALAQGSVPLRSAIQGTWNVESVNGQKLSSLGQKHSITFKGDAYNVTRDGQVKERGTFKIDDKKKPAEIDMKITDGVAIGATQIGIIQIAGDTLTLKTNTITTPKRPSDFSSEPLYVLIVAKKQ